jgi:putative FmdB family regulatory protein
MPIFEYRCKGCGHAFELLLLPSSPRTAACPECASEELEKVLSGFAVKSAELSQARVKKARAAMQQSRNVVDSKVAESEHIREHVSETLDAFKNLPKDHGKPS